MNEPNVNHSTIFYDKNYNSNNIIILIDAIPFLNLTKSYFPDAVLSLGWTTRFLNYILFEVIWPPHLLLMYLKVWSRRDILAIANCQWRFVHHESYDSAAWCNRSGSNSSTSDLSDQSWLIDLTGISTKYFLVTRTGNIPRKVSVQSTDYRYKCD